MKTRPPRRSADKPSRSAKKQPRRKPLPSIPRDPLFESLREELGL
jgi:hypothetical protein